MSKDPDDFVFENFQEFFGSVDQVVSLITDCEVCGSKMIFTHLPDYKNMLVQETARCTDCGEGSRKKIHIIN